MGASTPQGHPVLRHLAIVRAARDFGVRADELESLAARFPPAGGRFEELADAVSAAVLARRGRRAWNSA